MKRPPWVPEVQKLICKVKAEMKRAGVEITDEFALLVMIFRELHRPTVHVSDWVDEPSAAPREPLTEVLVQERIRALVWPTGTVLMAHNGLVDGQHRVVDAHTELLMKFITENCEKFFAMFVDQDSVPAGPSIWDRLLGEGD